MEAQQEAHGESLKTNTEYFAENIGKVRTVDDLMSDRRMLDVALKAFGLGDDINNKYFIRTVLSEGISDSDSLANKLADKSYYQMSEAFGFGEEIPPRTVLSGFASEIIDAYKTRQFEEDVGDQNEDFRYALHAQRALGTLAEKTLSEDGKWFSVMGDPPLRAVFETALGLPSDIGALDIDQQLKIFKDKAQSMFGDSGVEQFQDPAKLDRLIQTYLLRSEINSGSQALSSASAALVLLGNI
jgi:hypothetical protein